MFKHNQLRIKFANNCRPWNVTYSQIRKTGIQLVKSKLIIHITIVHLANAYQCRVKLGKPKPKCSVFHIMVYNFDWIIRNYKLICINLNNYYLSNILLYNKLITLYCNILKLM